MLRSSIKAIEGRSLANFRAKVTGRNVAYFLCQEISRAGEREGKSLLDGDADCLIFLSLGLLFYRLSPLVLHRFLLIVKEEAFQNFFRRNSETDALSVLDDREIDSHELAIEIKKSAAA